jgi:hypothetical protein
VQVPTSIGLATGFLLTSLHSFFRRAAQACQNTVWLTAARHDDGIDSLIQARHSGRTTRVLVAPALYVERSTIVDGDEQSPRAVDLCMYLIG